MPTDMAHPLDRVRSRQKIVWSPPVASEDWSSAYTALTRVRDILAYREEDPPPETLTRAEWESQVGSKQHTNHGRTDG